MAEILYSGAPKANGDNGFLPIVIEYIPDNDAPVILQLTGSVSSPNLDKMLGLKAVVNGSTIIKATVFSNLTNTHMALCPSITPYTFPYVVDNVVGPTPEDPNPRPQSPNKVRIEIQKLNDDTHINEEDHVTLMIL